MRKLLFIFFLLLFTWGFSDDPIVTYTITVKSVNPSSGVTIQATTDTLGLGAGVTTFSRIYEASTAVTLTAPATLSNGATFLNWKKNGVVETTDVSFLFEADANHVLTATYLGGTGNKFKTVFIPYGNIFIDF